LAVSYVAGRDRRRTTLVEEACLSRHILRYFTEREMSRERDEVLDQCREWLNRNLVEGDQALWTNERVRVWFQTNKHRCAFDRWWDPQRLCDPEHADEA
jgi:hypothetical protein